MNKDRAIYTVMELVNGGEMFENIKNSEGS